MMIEGDSQGSGDWRADWRAAGRRARSRIRHAVYRGDVLEDPREAALAVGLARRLLRSPTGWLMAIFGGYHPVIGALVWRRSVRRAERENLRRAIGS